MTITEFARERQVNPTVVNNYISKHRDELNDHMEKKGKYVFLDNWAIEFLGKRYPVPAPVPVVIDTESREKYLSALEEISRLKDKIIALEKEQSKAQATALLLAERSSELEAVRGQLSDVQAQKQEAEAEVERLRSRGFWARLTNR